MSVAVEGSTTIKTILAPMDFSPSSLQSVCAAAELAVTVGAKLVVMTAIPAPPAGKDEPSLEQRLETARMKLAHWYVSHLPPALRKRITTRFFALTGEPVEGIVEAAARAKANLIVMATHERGGLDRLFHPSVAQAVLHRSPTPVLLMKPEAATRARLAA